MFCRLTSLQPARRLLALLSLLLLLGACGQKGPLYLPDETEEEKQSEQNQ